MIIKFFKRAGQLIVIPIAVSLAVMLLLAAVFLLPTDRMKDHVRSTASVLEKEGLYFTITAEAGARHDNFIEALYLDQAIVGTQDESLMNCVMSGYHFVHKDKADTIDNLVTAVNDPGSVTLENTEYRFFNGQLILLKPLLMLMGYTGIRMFCAYTCILGTALLGWLMYKRKLARFILPVMISILFLRPIAVWMNSSFTLIYLCMLIPCLVMLGIKKETLRKKAWLIFGITGSATFCLNMNYFQLLSFGLPLLICFLITGIPEKPVHVVKTIADFFIAWMIGYAGAMLFKWAAYSVTTGQNIFREMIEHALWRSGINEGSRMETICFNAQKAFGNLWWDLVEAGFIVCTLIQWKKNHMKLKVSAGEIVLLLMMIVIPVGRFAILANHSMIHADFVYRLFMMPVLAFNLLLAKRYM